MAALVFFHGVMNSGKSTLALQMHDTFLSSRTGQLFTSLDRSGRGIISSRLGISQLAHEVSPDFSFIEFYRSWDAALDYVICDEAQFYTKSQVEDLGTLVDVAGIDVFAFGLATDFQSYLFPASRRLFEIADDVQSLPITALCWCGRKGNFNARVERDRIVREGDRVLLGDMEGNGGIEYKVLCRRHYRAGKVFPENRLDKD